MVAFLWQIVTVPEAGPQFEGSYVPLVVRAGLLLVPPVEMAIIALSFSDQADRAPFTAREMVLPALLLVLVAAVASVPVPARIPAFVQPLAETVAAALIIGGLGDAGRLFLPYLVMPLLTAGLNAGASVALMCAGIASGVILVTLEGVGNLDPNGQALTETALWIPIFVAVALLGSWIRRIREANASEGEPAYADAHRLLSELHVVARQLSLGLDPPTLAAALVDDVAAVVRRGTAGVLVRSPGGRFVPLVGPSIPDSAEAVVGEAWQTAETVSREAPPAFGDPDGDRSGSVAALPVLMGERVVAVVLLRSSAPLTAAILQRCQAVIKQSGPRMASAMLFDDVRRLASFDERMRLAREIHDGIAQDLASVGYLLDDIRSDVDDEVGSRVGKVRDQLRGMVTDLRLSIFDLRAGVDDTVGLGTALTEYVQRVGSQFGLIVHLSMGESPQRLPIALEVELLRMVQEAVTNVRRHSGAENLWLTLKVAPPSATITVADDGRGMQRARPDSMGISGMHERAQRIGARLTIGPRPEGGTLVQIVLDGTGRSRRTAATAATATTADEQGYPQRDGGNIPSIPETRVRSPAVDHADQEAMP
jgi:two-component sensor histidine kinase